MNDQKILVVEDDNFLGDLIVQHLRKDGLEVELSQDAETAYEAIKKEIPGLVLLDILLPGMSGLELLEKLRDEKIVPALPVIMLSNLTQTETMEKAMKLGARDFFGKASFDLDEISQKARRVLEETLKAKPRNPTFPPTP